MQKSISWRNKKRAEKVKVEAKANRSGMTEAKPSDVSKAEFNTRDMSVTKATVIDLGIIDAEERDTDVTARKAAEAKVIEASSPKATAVQVNDQEQKTEDPKKEESE